MMRPATMPMRSPVAIPRGPSTGRYRKMDELSMSRAAIAVCATLCANPPAALTPMTEKRCVLFSSAITARLREAPDTLYMYHDGISCAEDIESGYGHKICEAELGSRRWKWQWQHAFKHKK